MPRIRKLNEDEPMVTYSVLDREHSSSDFLNNPDLFKDALPQPYRRIDKILQDLIDDVWDIIEKNFNERQTELNKPRAAKYSPLSVLEGLDDFNCLIASSDEYNDYIFVGSKGFIYSIDVSAMRVVDKLDLKEFNQSDYNLNIVSLSTSQLKQSTHLVAALSDTGIFYMCVFTNEKFYIIQSLVEGDTDRKYLYKKCEISKSSDLIAFSAESKTLLSDCLIEVYKCPKEIWFQTIENILNKQQQLIENESAENTNVQYQLLAKPILLCRLKPPQNQFKFQTLQNAANGAQLLKTVDSSNQDLIGLGLNTFMTKSYIESKCLFAEKVFNIKLVDESINQLNGSKNIDLNKNKIEFKFLPSNRIIQSQSDNSDQPASLLVNWNNSNQLLFYNLIKITKDLDSKIEYSIPFSNQIESFQISKCSGLLLTCLANNLITIFDLNYGIERRLAYLNKTIKQVFFLPSPIPKNSLFFSSSVQFKVETRLACLCENGDVFLIDSGLGSNQEPKKVFACQLANNDDKLVHILPFKNIPNLILAISETKKIYLLSFDSSSLICELDYNQDKFKIDLENIQMALSIKNYQLYLKSFEKNESKSKLLCHSFRLISLLDNYLRVPHSILNSYMPLNASLNDRVKNYLKLKIDDQMGRKERLKSIWNELNKHRNGLTLTQN